MSDALTTYLASPDCREEVKAYQQPFSTTSTPAAVSEIRRRADAALNALCEQLHASELAEGYATRRAEQAEERIRELEATNANLLLEAQAWAMEGKTQRATVNTCLQAASGATGERGSWNGADPVRERIRELEAENERLKEWLHKALSYARYGSKADIDALETVIREQDSHSVGCESCSPITPAACVECKKEQEAKP